MEFRKMVMITLYAIHRLLDMEKQGKIRYTDYI